MADMRTFRRGRLAVPLLALSITLIGIALYLAAHRPSNVAPLDLGTVLFAAQFVCLSIVGGLVATKQPRNAAGWLMLTLGLIFGLSGVGAEDARRLYAADPAHGALLALAASQLFKLSLAGLALLVLVLPTGRFPTARWRWLAVALLLLLALAIAGSVTDPGPIPDGAALTPPENPLGLSRPVLLTLAAGQPGFLALGVIFLLAATSLFQRYRVGDAELRLQLKWVALAGLLLAGTFSAEGLFNWLEQPGRNWFAYPFDALAFAAVSLVAAAVAVAVLRHRLFDIDVVLSRSLSYGFLAVLITAFYMLIVAGIGALFALGSSSRLLMVVVSTAAAAVAFQPLRSRLQMLANRLVYGERARPYELLADFTAQLGAGSIGDEVLPTMARLLARGTACDAATVWLEDEGEEIVAASWPPDALVTATSATRTAVVRDGGQVFGRLAVWRRAQARLSPTEERLMDALAGQSGLLLRKARLQAELRQRLDDLRTSRQRLVTTQDEGRRRLERDLHDGAQQDLVSLRIKLGLAEAAARQQPDELPSLLHEMQLELGDALDSLRALARGIYPPVLASEGLRAALSGRARSSPIPVHVTCGPERYPPDIEAAVYFCCSEALQNVVKHASATHAWLRIWRADDELRFEVKDNGRGFSASPAASSGGLRNMRDRIEALDGRLMVDSEEGGAIVRGALRL